VKKQVRELHGKTLKKYSGAILTFGGFTQWMFPKFYVLSVSLTE
jgi:hypothetical protein